MIKPTIGSALWYIPPRADDPREDKSQPLAAQVILVHNDRLVSVAAFDQLGRLFTVEEVVLLQESDPPLPEGRYVMWRAEGISTTRAREKEAWNEMAARLDPKRSS